MRSGKQHNGSGTSSTLHHNRLSGCYSTGAAYIIGTTFNNFPTTPGAFQTTPGGQSDILVTKINPQGTALVYSTYIGGPNNDEGFDIAVDSQGNAYLTGPVNQGNPTIALDNSGNVWVTGNTNSTNFPLNSANDTLTGGVEAFVSRFNANGELTYSTYLGGSGEDKGNDIAVDSSGNAYVVGNTTSTDFITSADVPLAPKIPNIPIQAANAGGAKDNTVYLRVGRL